MYIEYSNMYIEFDRLSLAIKVDFGFIFQTQETLFDHAILSRQQLSA